METREFGARLRQLRKQACMTQRALADKIDVNFTYLSKIESGVIGPPSKRVILKLADVFNADKDELLILAGKVPSDVAEMLLKNGKTLQLIRSRSVHKIFKASNKIGTGLQNFTRSLKNSTNSAGLFFKNHKGFSRAAMAVAIVLAIVGALWSTTAVKAVELTLPDFPTRMYTNSSYSFYAQVDIFTNEAIPITKLRLDISGPTDAWVEFSVDGTIISQSNHFTSIQQVVSPYYGEGYGYGYGYGYDPSTGYGFITWGSYGYTGYGYGYGYGYSTGLPTQAKYLVTLNTSGMSRGSYQAQLACYVTATKMFLSSTSSFTMSRRGYAMPPGAPAAPPVSVEGVTDVSDVVTSEGVFTQDVTAESEDGKVELTIDKYTIGLTAEGEPLSEISIIPMEDPPAPPADASVVGLTYDLGPDGATFDPSITLTFTYDPDEVPTGVNLVIAIWDGEKWVELEGCIVDEDAHTITASVSHFTPFTILASLPVEEEEVVVAPPPVEEEEVVVVPPPVEEEEVVPEEEEEIVVPEEEEVVPVAGILWWVWVIIAAVVVIGGLLAYFLWWRRRTA